MIPHIFFFNEQKYETITEWAMEYNSEKWGETIFVPAVSQENYKPSFFLYNESSGIVYKFPDAYIFERNFDAIEDLVFKDINNDGKNDLLAIVYGETGIGGDGSFGQTIISIFFASEDGFSVYHDVECWMNFSLAAEMGAIQGEKETLVITAADIESYFENHTIDWESFLKNAVSFNSDHPDYYDYVIGDKIEDSPIMNTDEENELGKASEFMIPHIFFFEEQEYETVQDWEYVKIPEWDMKYNSEKWGETIFVPAILQERYTLSFFLYNKSLGIVYKFPDAYIFKRNFDSIGDLVFKDINNDGKNDLIAIVYCCSGTGSNGALGQAEISIFFASEEGFSVYNNLEWWMESSLGYEMGTLQGERELLVITAADVESYLENHTIDWESILKDAVPFNAHPDYSEYSAYFILK
jgi:hypothetical protein